MVMGSNDMLGFNKIIQNQKVSIMFSASKEDDDDSHKFRQAIEMRALAHYLANCNDWNEKRRMSILTNMIKSNSVDYEKWRGEICRILMIYIKYLDGRGNLDVNISTCIEVEKEIAQEIHHSICSD